MTSAEFLIYQFQRTSPPGIFCTFPRPMCHQPALNIIGNSGVQAPIPASKNIQLPELDHTHPPDCLQNF